MSQLAIDTLSSAFHHGRAAVIAPTETPPDGPLWLGWRDHQNVYLRRHLEAENAYRLAPEDPDALRRSWRALTAEGLPVRATVPTVFTGGAHELRYFDGTTKLETLYLRALPARRFGLGWLPGDIRDFAPLERALNRIHPSLMFVLAGRGYGYERGTSIPYLVHHLEKIADALAPVRRRTRRPR